MPEKSIIIIGGGIAGLSAGCYGQMNGFRTRIFEMHKKPGGLCTSWKRQGYIVNGCVHWLMGSAPGSDFYRMWQELGVVPNMTFVYHDEYARVENTDGQTLVLHADIDRLEQHMKELAPEDSGVIDEFIHAVRSCTRFKIPWEKAPEASGLLDLLKLLVTQFPLLRMLRKWNRISLTEYGKRFKNPLIREAFPLMFMPDFPVSFMLMTFAFMHKKAAGYPLGGSLEFSRAIEKRYLGLGGETNYKARVKKILTQNGRAVGIRLEDGTEYRADYVISAADGHETIFTMLEGRFVNDTILGYYDNKLILFPPLVFVALGVDRKFDDIPYSCGMSLKLQHPITIGGVGQPYVNVHAWNFDPALAPAGKTLLTVMFQTEYAFWKKLRENDELYKAEKERIADTVVNLLDKRFPGLAAQVEMRDVSTPTTFERYTGNWKGSFEGWQVTPTTWGFGKVMQKTLPGIDHFYMAGQWVEPGGGLPAVALSGRNVMQIICKKEKKRFTTTV
jgi:phytoene dehydrogenase-like protein